jgi:hypothetical protein
MQIGAEFSLSSGGYPFFSCYFRHTKFSAFKYQAKEFLTNTHCIVARTGPLLGNDRETNNERTPFERQQIIN